VLARDIAYRTIWAIETVEIIVVRKNARVVTPHHRANGLTWISLDAKRVIARSLEILASSVIVRKNLTIKNPSLVFANQLEFTTVAGDS